MNLNKKGTKIWQKDQDTLNELLFPFNEEAFLHHVDVTPSETLYEKINPTVSRLNPCVAVLKALSHLVGDKNCGYAIYDSGWVSQYRPDDKTCISTQTNGINHFSTTEKNGVTTNTNFDEVPEAWFFHIMAGMLLNFLSRGDCYNRNPNFYDELTNMISMYNTNTIAGVLTAKDVVIFTNDIYTHCLVQGFDYDDFPMLSASAIDENILTDVIGNVSFSKQASKKKVKSATLKDLLNKYTIGSSTNTTDKYDDFVYPEEVEKICKILKANALGKTKISQNFLFTGVAGTGKSSAAYMIARACNLNYSFVVGSENLTMDELLVNTTLGDKPGEIIKVESPLVKAFRDGGVIEFQEANCIKRPNVIQFLNPLLDDNGELTLSTGEKLVRNPQTVIIFTANVGYEGTKCMNQALLSRCVGKFEFELPDDTTLISRLIKKSGIAKDIAAKMVKVMHSIDQILEAGGYSDGCCSYRELENWAQMSMMFGNISEAAKFTIINSATNDLDGRIEVEEAVYTQFEKDQKIDPIDLS